ncbi:MAG: 3-deoxy-8-phosphooctulonate synthase [Phycisphaerales bacterium]|nr:3-deoxy-8-phosphooctulonate synthase [Phycisphaerales bacterium]
MPSTCRVGELVIGPDQPLCIIAGPCVLESAELGRHIGETLKAVCDRLGLSYIFKASFDKANRSSITSKRGPGVAQGLADLARLRDRLGVPVTTDIHEPAQAALAAEYVDLLQIPAFLCRQTDLLAAAGATGKAVNVKKGQFLSPAEMKHVVRKLDESGCTQMMLTERGTFFGYHRLVNDFIGLGDLMEIGPPVCFDATHSTQLPGATETSGGRPERAPLLARAAVAAGVPCVFLECHPEPSRGLSDASNMLRLDAVAPLLASLKALHEVR